MDPNMIIGEYYLLQHRHKDGSWAEMEEVAHHSPAAHDQERSWGFRRIFRCRTCEESATIMPGAEEADEQR